MTYDLLIKGGHVLDPGQGIDGIRDIAITDGKITKIAAGIPPEDAHRVVEIHGAGRHVVPGLIDLHTHVAAGAITEGVGMGMCDPDDIGVRSGVTTVVDCGSVGVANLGVFPAHILPRARTRVAVMVNAGSHEVEVLADGWTAVTKDRKLSAHFEHSVAIMEDGPLVLSRP